MTRTQYYTATSIDGFIADADDSLEWLFEAASGDDDPGGRFATFYAGIGAMAMGATTYRWVLDHEQLLDHPERWTGYYGDTPCWVFTHGELPRIPDVPLTFVQGSVAPVHQAMAAAAGGKHLWVVGGGDLVGQFADEGLLDDVFLGVAPVFLGSGAPLLPRRILSPAMTLAAVDHDAGFVHLHYTLRDRG